MSKKATRPDGKGTKFKLQWVAVNKVATNPNNPRLIKSDKFDKLVQSIKDFPEMLEIRPIVVDKDMVVLGGNMRLKACEDAGLKEVPIIKASSLTEAQKIEFLIKDNVNFGEFDWDILANEFDSNLLTDWGLDVPKFQDDQPADDKLSKNCVITVSINSEEEAEKLYDKLIKDGYVTKIKY